jgi:glycosyltransferase involved in cell wall biosynthesis
MTASAATPRQVRVLHVVTHFSDAGGAEVSLAQMLPHLAASGVTSTVLPLRGRSSRRIGELEAQGILIARPSGGRLLADITAVMHQIASFKPDVVHTSMWDADLAGRMAAKLARLPVLTTLINAQYSAEAYANARNPWALRGYQALDALLARYATSKFHAITTYASDEARRSLRIAPQDIHVIYRGRDRDSLGEPSAARREAVRSALEIPNSAPVLVNVARNDPQKRLDLLVGAFSKLLQACPDAVLLQAGRPGSSTPHLVSMIRRTGLTDRIRLLGRRTDVPDLLAASDVFMFSSLWEGLGGAVVEAMGMELPVVAFDIPPIRETTNGAALLVEPHDTSALAQAAASLLSDEALRRDATKRGRHEFETRFRVEVIATQMASLYRHLARAPRER